MRIEARAGFAGVIETAKTLLLFPFSAIVVRPLDGASVTHVGFIDGPNKYRASKAEGAGIDAEGNAVIMSGVSAVINLSYPSGAGATLCVMDIQPGRLNHPKGAGLIYYKKRLAAKLEPDRRKTLPRFSVEATWTRNTGQDSDE